jgi:two-component system, cell cycle response regulator DivK
VKDTGVPAPSPDAQASGAAQAEGALVLIVDDNQRNRKLARDVLLAAGFRTLEAANGTEGMTLASKHLPNVILMDLRLPDMDGTDAARKLANEARTSNIPVVALSSLALEGGSAWLRGSGFAGYLEKPIDIRKFPGQVRRYCSWRSG